MFTSNAFAIEENSFFVTKLLSWIADSIYAWLLKWAVVVISTLIGFLAWLLTFGILFLSNLMDLVFIKVPYIGDILGIQWEDVYKNTISQLTTIILMFSLSMWLILGWAQYIKRTIDEISIWGQGGDKWSLSRDLWVKLFVVILILTIPLTLPVAMKGVNSLSAGILRMETSGFAKSDQIIIASKPVTSLVELWLGLPAVDGLSNDREENEDLIATSIHNRKNGEGIENGNIQFSLIFDSIIKKSMFQYGRFVNLATTISDKETVENIVDSWATGTATRLEQQAIGQREWLVIFFFIAIFYVVMLYTIFNKLFAIFMALVTRFVSIIMTSMYLPFHFALLGSENTREFGKRNIWSFVWDILVTPVIAWYVGIAILVLGFFASVIGAGDDSFIYFATGTDVDGYESVLFTGMLVLAILYGMLNKLFKVIEYVGANFENIVATKWGAWIQDSYATPGDAMSAANQTMSLWKTVGTMMGLWVAASQAKWAALNKGKTIVGWDPKLNQLKEQAEMEGLKQANASKLTEITKKTVEKHSGNNTKIQK